MYHCREHMVRKGIWDVFSFMEPCNQRKTWYLFLKQSRFTLYYVKLYVKTLNKFYKANGYVVHNLTW